MPAQPENAAADQATPEADVLIRREGAITHITLNRPRALNALTREMVVAIRSGVQHAASDGSQVILLDGAGDRGFCGGGDVKAMAAGGIAGALGFLWAEYQADYALHTSVVPVAGIMDGITMGGGIGLTGHATHRVVTERSRLAMPETRIGIVPDVGGNLLLSRAPGFLGEYLSLPSGGLSAGDAIALGFADYFVPSERLAELRDRLAAGEDPTAAIEQLSEAAPPSSVLAAGEWFDPIAKEHLGNSEAVLAAPATAAVGLVTSLERSGNEEAQALAASIRGVCPTSVAVSVWQLAQLRAAPADLARVLADDYRTLGRLLPRSDFAEGVRAQLIDKDGAPKWQPRSLEALENEAILQLVEQSPRAGEGALEL